MLCFASLVKPQLQPEVLDKTKLVTGHSKSVHMDNVEHWSASELGVHAGSLLGVFVCG